MARRFELREKDYIRALWRGRACLLDAAFWSGYLRARYQRDAKSSDVTKEVGALAHDAQGALNQGALNDGLQPPVSAGNHSVFCAILGLRDAGCSLMTVIVYSSPVALRSGLRLSPRALGSFSAMPSVSARERISIHTSAGSMPARCHSATRW